MASVNKVILIGNLGREPETRYTADGGTAICNIVIATSRRYKNSQGELQEETEWHRVVFFGRQAEVAQQYLHKGSPVYIEGRLRTRRYTDKDGIERYATEIVCETMQLLPNARSQSGQQHRDESFETAYQPARQPAAHDRRALNAVPHNRRGSRRPLPGLRQCPLTGGGVRLPRRRMTIKPTLP